MTNAPVANNPSKNGSGNADSDKTEVYDRGPVVDAATAVLQKHGQSKSMVPIGLSMRARRA